MRYVCDTLSVSSNAYCHSVTRLVSFFAFRYSVPDSLTTTNPDPVNSLIISGGGRANRQNLRCLFPCDVFRSTLPDFPPPPPSQWTMRTTFASFSPFSSVGQTIVNFIFYRFSLCFPPRKRNVFVFVRTSSQCTHTYILTHTLTHSETQTLPCPVSRFLPMLAQFSLELLP